jgi:hypothetical protein
MVAVVVLSNAVCHVVVSSPRGKISNEAKRKGQVCVYCPTVRENPAASTTIEAVCSEYLAMADFIEDVVIQDPESQ